MLSWIRKDLPHSRSWPLQRLLWHPSTWETGKSYPTGFCRARNLLNYPMGISLYVRGQAILFNRKWELKCGSLPISLRSTLRKIFCILFVYPLPDLLLFPQQSWRSMNLLMILHPWALQMLPCPIVRKRNACCRWNVKLLQETASIRCCNIYSI